MSVELVLRFIGGILAGATASQMAAGLVEPTEPPLRAALLLFGVAAACFAVGFALTPYVTTVPFFWFRERILQASGSDYLVGGLGLIIGLVCGVLLQPPLSLLPGGLGTWLPITASLALAYLGMTTMIHHKRAVLALFGAARDRAQAQLGPASERVLVDTSAIIDGRIAEVAQTGFLFCTLVVPRCVLAELQQVADSTDPGKRARGRRGLDVLEQLQKQSLAPVEILDSDLDGAPDVDAKLVRLAREHEWALLTNDYHLNRVAGLQGIRVLNINQLAIALKPLCVPGDVIQVRLVHEGRDAGQGVGYLVDGTMVVVENGSRQVGEEVPVVVTRAIQTAAGRIIFGRLRERPAAVGRPLAEE